jgi:hypothetical protein
MASGSAAKAWTNKVEDKAKWTWSEYCVGVQPGLVLWNVGAEALSSIRKKQPPPESDAAIALGVAPGVGCQLIALPARHQVAGAFRAT